jgi:tRNA(Ile)-lysidine synthase
MLRGAESDQDEDFVRELCEKRGVELAVRRVEVQRLVSESRRNLEDCARRARYAFLFEVASAWSAAVATAHTLNDLTETFLLKLFRGAGLTGLAGIFPLRENRLADGATVDVIRPLIDATRKEILDYLAVCQQTFREDSSNLDISFDRNEVRRGLIPLLEARFNPEVVRVIGRTANLALLRRSWTRCIDAAASKRRTILLWRFRSFSSCRLPCSER